MSYDYAGMHKRSSSSTFLLFRIEQCGTPYFHFVTKENISPALSHVHNIPKPELPK